MKACKELLWGLALLTFVPQVLPGQVVLDTALVSAAREERSLMGANRNVQVISGEDLQKLPAQSVAQVLDFVPGVDSRQRGMWGTQTDISIRGGTFEQALVLVDGVRLSDPQTGHHLMNLPVQKDDIERIEVLMGGGSYIFGAQAFSGVINIITRESEKNSTSVNAAAGSFGSQKYRIAETMRGENHQSRISLTHTQSDGFKENTDFSNTQLSGQSKINLGENRLLRLNGGYTWQNFGAQNFYSDLFPDQYEKTRTLFLSAALKTGDKVKLSREVYWRRNWDEFQLFREGPGFYQYDDGHFIRGNDTVGDWYQGHNYHRSDVLGGKVDAAWNSAWGRTTLGADYRLEQVKSNNLGHELEAPINIDGSRGAYTLGAARHNVAFAGEHNKDWSQWSMSLALQANYNTDFGLDWFPAITMGYQPGTAHKFYGSVNRSFRLPSYTDLFYNQNGAQGSEDLQPEHSLNYELGYKYQGSSYFANISLFRREGRDIIDWIRRCPECDLIASNTSILNMNGVEGQFRWQGSEQKPLPIPSLDFIDLGYSYLFSENTDVQYQSIYALDFLQHKATMRFQHTLWEELGLNYSISYQDRRGSYTDQESGDEVPYPVVTLINAGLHYSWRGATLYVNAQNLMDQRYFDRGNVELPGLWMWTGLKYQF